MQLCAGKPALGEELPGHCEKSHSFPLRTPPSLLRGPFTHSRTVLLWEIKVLSGEHCGVFRSCCCPCSVCSLSQATLVTPLRLGLLWKGFWQSHLA